MEGFNFSPPSSGADLQKLSSIRNLPRDYMEFLEKSDGSEGFIGESYLILYSARTVPELNRAMGMDIYGPGLLIFASNGGGKSYAFDITANEPTILEFYDMDLLDREFCHCGGTLAEFFEYISTHQ
jgi:hypothetical protein